MFHDTKKAHFFSAARDFLLSEKVFFVNELNREDVGPWNSPIDLEEQTTGLFPAVLFFESDSQNYLIRTFSDADWQFLHRIMSNKQIRQYMIMIVPLVFFEPVFKNLLVDSLHPPAFVDTHLVIEVYAQKRADSKKNRRNDHDDYESGRTHFSPQLSR